MSNELTKEEIKDIQESILERKLGKTKKFKTVEECLKYLHDNDEVKKK